MFKQTEEHLNLLFLQKEFVRRDEFFDIINEIKKISLEKEQHLFNENTQLQQQLKSCQQQNADLLSMRKSLETKISDLLQKLSDKERQI